MMEEETAEPKARKACINCRRQKMKCRVDSGNNTCRRCQRAGLPCVFVPRANASAFMVPATLPLTDLISSDATRDILRRVQAIEEHIGLSETAKDTHAMSLKPGEDEESPEEEGEEGDPNDLWEASACLERSPAMPRYRPLWKRSTVKALWQSYDLDSLSLLTPALTALRFHDRMPGFHFLPSKQNFTAPQPLLLASILYCSSIRGSVEHAQLAPRYFTVLCNAIAQLSIPNSEIGTPPDDAIAAEEWGFQTVLGLILAGLLNEGIVRETGLWISIAYRLILEHCPPQLDNNCRDWQKLFQGVQIVDLEHASLHLSSPVIPIEPPFPALQISHRDQLHRLSRMMHTGLSRFSGRGLPTIYSCFANNFTDITASSFPFTPVDAAVIRDWARHLDDWLVQLTKTGEDSDQQRTEIFRQYVLHRLVVLSIYHPARGCDLQSNSITFNEQHELLLSARATIRLHSNDTSIWSNWDLIIITWAALIVIQGIKIGTGQPDDVQNIRIHLNMLRQTNEPKPCLRDKLATRLEQDLEGVQTPSPSTMNHHLGVLGIDPELDGSWQIFDETIMTQVIDPFWARPEDM